MIHLSSYLHQCSWLCHSPFVSKKLTKLEWQRLDLLAQFTHSVEHIRRRRSPAQDISTRPWRCLAIRLVDRFIVWQFLNLSVVLWNLITEFLSKISHWCLDLIHWTWWLSWILKHIIIQPYGFHWITERSKQHTNSKLLFKQTGLLRYGDVSMPGVNEIDQDKLDSRSFNSVERHSVSLKLAGL